MGKKGYNPYEKQSSTLSANDLIKILLANDFEVATRDTPIETKTAYRKDVAAAKRQFGECADISITGRSVTMVGRHVETGQMMADIRVPLSGMLGIGERDALFKKTGIPELAAP